MIDWFLAIVAGIIFVGFFLLSTYILLYYQHTDDESSFPLKWIFVFTITITMTNVLMLPLDVASLNSNLGGIPMDYLWYSVQISIAALCFLFLPFGIFFYQAGDSYDNKCPPCCSAFLFMFLTLAVFMAVTVVSYFFIGYADVEMVYHKSGLVSGNQVPADNTCPNGGYTSSGNCNDPLDAIKTFDVSIFVYAISIICIFAYLLFAIFGGIGLIAAPLDFLNDFIYRPLPVSGEEYRRRKLIIADKVSLLLETGVGFKESNASKKSKNEWKKSVYQIDDLFRENELAYKKKGGPVIIYVMYLIISILCMALSILWILQIVFWPLTFFHPFLNNMFVALDGLLSFFGTVIYGIFSFYLLLCVFKGFFSFNLRIPFLFSIHPMKEQGTMINGLLINGGILLLCSVATIKFCTDSFSLYTRLTVASSIFQLGVTNIRYLRFFWKYYLWGFLGIAFIALVLFLINPVDKERAKMISAQRKRRAEEEL